MGEFFNQKLKNLKKLPDSKTLEQMRKDFNKLKIIPGNLTESVIGTASLNPIITSGSETTSLSVMQEPHTRMAKTRKARKNKRHV